MWAVDDNSRLQVVGRRHPQRLGGAVAELGTLGDYIRALGGELKVIADFGDSWRHLT
jgi:hypothetical protein